MGAHNVAIPALNEVATPQPSESRVAESAPPTSTDITAASIETSKSATIANIRDTSAFISFQSSSSNNSQTTVPDPATPPTSDEFSSQSQQSPSQLSQRSQAAILLPSSPQLTGVGLPTEAVATAAGQKRTIDGHVKPLESRSSSSVSPPTNSSNQHSRHISSASSNASSRELVSELRTRLSYAIVKVNKGWEDLPINEVESRTSQAGSPTSSTSTLQGRRNLIGSPRTAIASLQNHSRNSLACSTAASVSAPLADPPCPDGQPSRTYESFWREQSHRAGSVPITHSLNTFTNPSLAPPADITSAARQASHPRRSEAPRFTKPPALVSQSTSDLSQNRQLSIGAQSPTPRTPNRTINVVDAILHTSNQKSLQERDAIETLLFMSSPGNSSTMGHSFPPQGQASQQPSPLRADFGAPLQSIQQQNIDFTLVGSNVSSEAGSVTPVGKRRDRNTTRMRRLGDDAYDIMLDRMPDTDSSDDEIEIPITPRRLAASRA